MAVYCERTRPRSSMSRQRSKTQLQQFLDQGGYRKGSHYDDEIKLSFK
jgi:hypothetical protein